MIISAVIDRIIPYRTKNPAVKFLKFLFRKLGFRRYYVTWLTAFTGNIEPSISRLITHKQQSPLIIRVEYTYIGICCYFNCILGGLAYADRKNMLPVVDLMTYRNNYLYDDEVGRINSWEYYFTQPSGITLDEAVHDRTTMTIEMFFGHNPLPNQNAGLFADRFGELSYWRKIRRKYIRFSPEVMKRLELMKKEYSGRKILGVKIRGTDYVTTKPAGHPIQSTAEQAVAKAKEAMLSEGFDSVYLATEDKRILAKFRDAFGDRLILPDTQYIDYDYTDNRVWYNWLFQYHNDRPNDKYLSGLEYIVSVLFLSQCKGLIASVNNGSVSALILSDGFDYMYIFDLGVYK